jgi:tRNA U54 and U55 pseudouridine synthase Pus10
MEQGGVFINLGIENFLEADYFGWYLDEWDKEVAEAVVSVVRKLSEYEYDSFLVGIKANPDIENREDELRSRFEIRWGESIRNEYSREIGKK